MIDYEKSAFLLSIVVPVYKEEKNIPEFLRRLTPLLESITAKFEIIFVMDPSPDQTEKVVEAVAPCFREVVV